MIDLVLNGLDHDDGIVHDDADRQHQPEHAGHVDAEAEQRKQRKRANDGDGTVSSGMSVARQFCRNRKTTRMTSDDRDEQRLDNIANRGPHEFRRVIADGVIDALRETSSLPRQETPITRSAVSTALAPGDR